MGIGWKKWLSKYGIRFAGLYILSFFLLVTFFGRFGFQTFPGDILIERGTFVLYLPFASAFAFAIFFLIIFEVYKNLR